MPQARDIMAWPLTTCSPRDTAAKVAHVMRDHNIGDVLVAEEGKLVGIVTDRDIALRVTAKSLDPSQVAVRDVMSARVVTGEPDWDLDKIAQTMGKHQIRRLPIAENGMLVGIVSLGDIARRNGHKSHVASSLKEISESHGTHSLRPVKRGLQWVTLGLGLAVGAAVALYLFPDSGGKLWEQIQSRQIGHRLLSAVQAGRECMLGMLDSI